ncbi:hypothetical protein [Streptomyces sp. NPDC020362]|uniref:hypothetical protein n=1 Tax=unclassified Streptomyces TaxID=2593676 RepID=UPI000A80C42B
MAPSRNLRLFAGGVVTAEAIASGYLTVAGLLDPGGLVPGGDSAAAKTYAAYVATRSLVLLGALIWLMAVRAWQPLGLVFTLNAAVQIGDVAIGVAHHQLAQTIGPLVFAALLLAAARPLGGLTWSPEGPSDGDMPAVAPLHAPVGQHKGLHPGPTADRQTSLEG